MNVWGPVIGIVLAFSLGWISCYARKSPKPLEPLEPGDCECTHNRCKHDDGKGECQVSRCSCQLYIRAYELVGRRIKDV